MSLEENISHCFREYPKMKLRIEILETENQRLQEEVARLREALERIINEMDDCYECERERCPRCIARAALEVKP